MMERPLPFFANIDTMKIGDDWMKDLILKKYQDLMARLEGSSRRLEKVPMDKWASSLDLLMHEEYSKSFPIDSSLESFGESEQIFLMGDGENKNIDDAVGVITVGMKSLSMDYMNRETGAYSFVSIEEEMPNRVNLLAHICDDKDPDDVIDISSGQVAMNDCFYTFMSDDVLEKASMVNALKNMNGYDNHSSAENIK